MNISLNLDSLCTSRDMESYREKSYRRLIQSSISPLRPLNHAFSSPRVVKARHDISSKWIEETLAKTPRNGRRIVNFAHKPRRDIDLVSNVHNR